MTRPTTRASLSAITAGVLLLTACGGSETTDVGAGPGSATDEVASPDPDATTASPGEGQGVAEGEPDPNRPSDVSGGEAECSASAMMVAAVQPQGVTEAAAATWNEMRSLALACDYEGLAALGDEGEPLGFSFGGETDAATFWAERESGGAEPMAKLIEITGLPAAAADDQGEDGWFVWPAVHAEPSDDGAWEDVATIYAPDVIDQWRQAGAYYGHRIAITPEGDWIYFTSGD